MKLFCVIALAVSGVFAALSLLAVPFWLMGVPGVQNSYAKGWKIGLYVVGLYPVAWLCIFRYWWTAKKQMGVENMADLNLWVGTGALGMLAVAAGVVFYAFKVMSRT